MRRATDTQGDMLQRACCNGRKHAATACQSRRPRLQSSEASSYARSDGARCS